MQYVLDLLARFGLSSAQADLVSSLLLPPRPHSPASHPTHPYPPKWQVKVGKYVRSSPYAQASVPSVVELAMSRGPAGGPHLVELELTSVSSLLFFRSYVDAL